MATSVRGIVKMKVLSGQCCKFVSVFVLTKFDGFFSVMKYTKTRLHARAT